MQRATLLSALIRLGNMALGLLAMAVLLRAMGVAGFGQYTFVMSVVMVASIPTKTGLPQFVVRETAGALKGGNTGRIHAVWKMAHRFVLVTLGLLAAVLFLWLLLRPGPVAPQSSAQIWIVALILVALLSLGALRAAALQGLGRTALAQLPEMIIRPALMILFVLVAARFAQGRELSAETGLLLQAGALALAFLFGAAMLWRHRPAAAPTPSGAPAGLAAKGVLLSVLVLGIATSITVLNNNIAFIMLGVLRDSVEVAQYKAASILAMLVLFGTQTIAPVITPRFAAAKGDKARLQKLAVANARFSFLLAAILAGSFALFGEALLVLLMGEALRPAYAILLILALGQMVSAGFGHPTILLNMTGNEDAPLRAAIVAVTANAVLVLALVPAYGAQGAAIATVAALLVNKAVMLTLARTRLGIRSTAFFL